MSRRYIVHSAVLVMVALSAIRLPAPVSVTVGRVEGEVASPRLIEWTEPENLPRARESVRIAEPSPLPSPVPIDPDATPLPGPTTMAEPPEGDSAASPSTHGGREPEYTPLPDTSKPSLRWPVNGTVSQWYSAGHPALDIAAPAGSPVMAPASGTVTFAGWGNNGGGYQVHIDTGWAIVGVHHLAAVLVTPGQWVNAGDLVGSVGCTGLCTGPHVHLNVLVDGWWRNPLEWL